MATDELVALDPVTLDLAALEAAASAVPDPELPVVTLGDLGIIRGVSLTDDGAIEVRITPTFVGCPATEAIAADVRVAVAACLRESGAPQTEVRTRTAMSPAWSTDWISEDGRRKLAEHGIAPPSGGARHRGGPVAVTIGRGGVGDGGADAGAGVVSAGSAQSAGGVVSAGGAQSAGSAALAGSAESAGGAGDGGAGAGAVVGVVSAGSAQSAGGAVEAGSAQSAGGVGDDGAGAGAGVGAVVGVASAGSAQSAGGVVSAVSGSSSSPFPSPHPPTQHRAAQRAAQSCPRCGSGDTRELSAFGSTPCQSLRACRACGEPFGAIKSL
ncbi:protein of unknown function DUF59 [Catenulispora acidiphila DSM 44928]|uniref:Uncharacterized protein n=1 Tax=Catenulispora acidiphila (strain DSM 44928 / JCM 14897 / NBRC 102108 / NRRL B-24433 / ID139908) TaxID=479433 RepID=C7QCV8_CATAD|nr:1,2-phenylacetyl-CoA epoxidase subunit PaaD [Catenulispora acidiphila]ACU70668.1 protein of unknown function DUF59 [Catenulispora acidiphila DSM 44928]